MLVILPAMLAMVGLLPGIGGLVAARRFAAKPGAAQASAAPAAVVPLPITVMKPLCGAEPGLEAALVSFFEQDYPGVQLVFGVQNPADPALEVVARLRARYPDHDVAVLADPAVCGMNRKISNLVNMLPAARHDTLVFADSDLTVPPGYLARLQAALQADGVGLVTTLSAAVAGVPGVGARLGAAHLTYGFLPGALLSRAMGRQDCLGTTMAITRQTLARLGGLATLVDHVADDNVLGQRVRRLGLSVALADTVPVVGVQDRSLAELWSHEMRWARTIRALAPWAYAASAIQYPIAWAALTVLLSGAAGWALALLGVVWAGRALVVRGLRHALAGPVGHPPAQVPVWLLPLRDLLSLAILIGSFRSGHVVWRGHHMRADRRPVTPFVYDTPPALAAD